MTTYAYPSVSLRSTRQRPVPRCITDLSAFFDEMHASRSFMFTGLGYISGGSFVYPVGDHRTLTLSQPECLLIESVHGDTYLASRQSLSAYLREHDLPTLVELEAE